MLCLRILFPGRSSSPSLFILSKIDESSCFTLSFTFDVTTELRLLLLLLSITFVSRIWVGNFDSVDSFGVPSTFRPNFSKSSALMKRPFIRTRRSARFFLQLYLTCFFQFLRDFFSRYRCMIVARS